MKKLLKNSKGFTLVELMVVILIIAILIAVAVPVFLGARNRAYQNRAKQSLTNAARAASAFFAGSTPQVLPTVAQMNAEEPSYTFSDAVLAPAYVNAKDAIALDETGATGIFRITANDSSDTVYKITVSPANGSIGAITTGN